MKTMRKPLPPVQLNSQSLLCACPDCQSPMTVRVWLGVADCWHCGTSIALEDLAELQELDPVASDPLQPVHAEPATQADPATAAPRIKRRMAPAESAPPASRVAKAPAVTPTSEPAAELAITPPSVAAVQRRINLSVPLAPPISRQTTRPWAWLWNLPAWLVSLLLHLLLLIALGLLNLRETREPERIVLSTAVGTQHEEGGRTRVQMDADEPAYDLPVPDDESWQEPARQAELAAADQDARELRMDPTAEAPHLPSLRELRRTLSEDSPRRLFATRDPRVRAELVRREGGTTLTEAAVARGLRWLAIHQQPDGSWSLHRFHDHPACDGRCNGRAHLRSDCAATALALLPFLGAGQTPQTGIYHDEVRRGLEWLVDHQERNGDLRYDADGQPGMYVHGQATIVLSEAFAMTGDPALKRAAQKAVNFIVDAQHRRGGWRYRPG
ncbi:MAG: hypothetical protein KDB23_23970, partial [Planctomycetales bacterium]|nr:hypothetical protein [Planctomycetales bacterium]